MTQKVGGVEFDVTVDSSSAVTAASRITKSNADIEKSFEAVENATKRLPSALSRISNQYSQGSSKLREFIAQQVEAGRSFDENGNVVTAYGVKARNLTEQFDKLKRQFLDTKASSDKVEQAFKDITAETKEAAEATNLYTVKQKDFIGPMQKVEREVEKSTKAVGGLGRNLGMAGVQFQQFFGQIQGGQGVLLPLSQQAADLGFVLGRAGLGASIGIAATALAFLIPLIRDAEPPTDELKERIKELGEETKLTAEQIRFLGNETNKELNEISESSVNLADSIAKANKELSAMQSAGTGLDTGQFAVPRSAEENQRRYAERIKETEERLDFLKAALATNNQETIKLNKATTELGNKTDKVSKEAQSYTITLQSQVIALQHGAEAGEIYAATQRAIADGTTSQIPQIVKLIQEKYRLKDAQLAAAETAKQEADAQRNYESVLDQIIAKEEQRKKQKEADKEQAQQGLDAFRESLMTEQQLRAQAYLTELEQLKEAKDQKLITQAEYDALEKEKAQQHAAELVAIEKERHNKEMQLEQQKRQAKLALVGDIFGNLASLMNTGSKKLFAIGKAAAVANAVVDGYAAVQKTMASVPYPFNVPLAAAQAVASAAQVKGIMSTKFGSAGSGQSYSGGQVVNNTATQQAQQPEQRNISIAVTGGYGSMDDMARALVPALNEALGDGYNFKVNGG